MLGNLQVIDLPFAGPRDNDEVKNSPTQPVPDAVFGPAGHAGMVGYRQLADHRAGIVGEDRHKTVQSVERKEHGDDGTFEGSQVAAGILEIDAQDETAREPGDPSGDAAAEVILSPHAHAAGQVAVFERSNQFWQVGRIVLEVAVEGGDELTAAGLESGPQRGALATMFHQTEGTDPKVSFLSFEDLRPGVVRAGVVHQQQLEAAGFRFEGQKDAFGQGADIGGFVPERGNDRDLRSYCEGSRRRRVRRGRTGFHRAPLCSRGIATRFAGVTLNVAVRLDPWSASYISSLRLSGFALKAKSSARPLTTRWMPVS